MIQMHKNEEGRYEITESEYERAVSICERILQNTTNDQVLDSKKKFTNSAIYPTIDELSSHDIEARFELYFPYLVYYEDVFQCDDPEFREAQEYIADLLYDMLEIIPDEEAQNADY